MALNLTDPDRFYTTGCVLQGSTPPFEVVLQKAVYSFNMPWDRDAHNPFGLTATPLIFTAITIEGNGATLQWTGTGNSRLFAVGTASIVRRIFAPNKGPGNITLQRFSEATTIGRYRVDKEALAYSIRVAEETLAGARSQPN